MDLYSSADIININKLGYRMAKNQKQALNNLLMIINLPRQYQSVDQNTFIQHCILRHKRIKKCNAYWQRLGCMFAFNCNAK